MSHFLLDRTLLVLVLFVVMGALASRKPPAPDGIVRVWLVAVVSFLAMLAFMVAACARGSFDWTGLNRGLQYAAGFVVTVTFVALLMFQVLCAALPVTFVCAAAEVAILAGCYLSLYGPGGSSLDVSRVGLASLFGLGVIGGLVLD